MNKQTQHTPEEVEAALRIFIESGSANGREELRGHCKRNVKLYAAAPELLTFVELVASLTDARHTEESEIDAVITVNRLRQEAQAAVAKVRG